MGKAYVEEKILHSGLCKRKNKDLVPRVTAGDEQPAVENAANDPGQNTGEREAITGKQDLLECVRCANAEHFISNFNARECAAPEQSAEYSTKNQKKGVQESLSFHVHSMITRKQRVSNRPGLITLSILTNLLTNREQSMNSSFSLSACKQNAKNGTF